MKQNLRLEWIDPLSLSPNPLNWRRHPSAQRAALEDVLAQVGWAGVLLYNEQTGHLIDGHLRQEIALDKGDGSVPVLVGNWTEEQERLILATLDPIAAMAEKNGKPLTELLEAIREQGRQGQAIQAILDELAKGVIELLGDDDFNGDPVATSSDEAERLRRKWGVEPGRLWRIPSRSVLGGEHRIICGDSTDLNVVTQVMDGEKAAMMWTDPPYGVEYEGGTAERLTIAGDSADELPTLLRAAFNVADGVLIDGAPIYVAHPSGTLQLVFGEAILAAGWHLHETLVWVKDRMVLGHSDYHYQHEPVYYGWKGKNRRWYGGRDKTTVFHVVRPTRNADHPTVKPVELVAQMIANSSRRGDIIFDPFLGSGTTLVACERLGRLGRGVEIVPKYVAVALQRLADMGLEPELIDAPLPGDTPIAACREGDRGAT